MSYLPHTTEDMSAMLAAIGVGSLDDLFGLIPADARYPDLGLPPGEDETTVLRGFEALAARNLPASAVACFLGGGARRHFIPAAVRHIVERSEFSTAYGLSHAEVHQGILQVLYEFQSYVCRLTGLDVTNNSLYDGASALGEAGLMAARATGRRRLVAASTLHPAYRQVLGTYAAGYGLAVDDVPWDAATGTSDVAELGRRLDADVAAVVVQHPNFFGALEPVTELVEVARRHGVLLVAVVDAVSLGLLKPPGAWGADIAVGEAQGLGNPLQGGGPYLGFLACRDALYPHLPGAVVGLTRDAGGRRAFALADAKGRSRNVQRERATSNVGTVSVLPALAAVAHLALLGPDGFRQVARACYQNAHHLADRLQARHAGCLAFRTPFFAEFVVRLARPAEEAVETLAGRGILAGVPLSRWWPDWSSALLIAATEMNTPDEMERVASALEAWL